jgi:hypothetical protein
VGRPQMWCMPDQTISIFRRGDKGDRRSPVLGPPFAERRATAVYHSTLCYVEHIFLHRGVRYCRYVTRERRVRGRDRYLPPS